MENNKDKIKGKIVCFNNPWVEYYESVVYREQGPSKAAKYGALAVIARSLAPASIYSVHAGVLIYDPEQPKIPGAAITV